MLSIPAHAAALPLFAYVAGVENMHKPHELPWTGFLRSSSLNWVFTRPASLASRAGVNVFVLTTDNTTVGKIYKAQGGMK